MDRITTSLIETFLDPKYPTNLVCVIDGLITNNTDAIKSLVDDRNRINEKVRDSRRCDITNFLIQLNKVKITFKDDDLIKKYHIEEAFL